MIKLKNLLNIKKISVFIILSIAISSCKDTKTEENPKEITQTKTEAFSPIFEISNPSKIDSSISISSQDSELVVITPVKATNNDLSPELNKNISSSETAPITIDTNQKRTAKTVLDTNTIVEPAPVVFSHSIFDDLLKKYVTASGNVNYKGVASERAKLKTYLALLSSNEPQSNWSDNKKLAYWINVYNAYTIELILENNIPSSIMNINNNKAWDVRFINIGSKKHTLNDIEHNIIRKQFDEPRIHFACVCAAKSCPKLLNEAYTESNLKKNLQAQAVYFINNTSKNEIADKNLKVSRLFEWYAEDFGEINAYIRKYSKTSFKDDKNIEYLTYDWDLND